MTTRPGVSGSPSVDGCAEQRATVETRCDEARVAKTAHEAAVEHIRELRRDLVAAQHKLTEAAVAADPKLRSAEKAAARDTYEMARRTAQTDTEVSQATAVWAGALDRINRSGRLTRRAVSRAKAGVADIEAALRESEQDEQTSRIRAEQAEASCLDARVRLAACEEGSGAPAELAATTVSEPHAATRGHVAAISEGESSLPLVIESMVSGDRRALELAAVEISDHTVFSPAEAQLQLQELVDAIVSAAAEDGFLVFDTRHPFWAHLSFEEARDVIGALARLGFLFEPAVGWHAGRAPTPSDLSMALAYAGLDARNMRDLPDVEDLRLLPASIGVNARAFLAAQAPELAVDQLVLILGRRASQLDPLWNEWGQVRPVLLTDRHALGTVPG